MQVDLYLDEIETKARELNASERKELQAMLKSPVLQTALSNIITEARGKERAVLNTNLTQENVVEVNGERGVAQGMNRAVAAIVEMVNG